MIPLPLRPWLIRMARPSPKRQRRTHRPTRYGSRPALEVLEGRWVPSTVTNLNDAGAGSLRQAILDTPSGGTVDFQPGLSGTITLTSGELAITKDLTIAGLGANVITVSGNHASRVFDISAKVTVGISGLTIADSYSNGFGGGIYNTGTLTITDSTINDNSAGTGAGIANSGTLTVTASVLSGNSAGEGGGIFNGGGTVTVMDSTLSGNSATDFNFGQGGGICNQGTLTITASTLSGNSTTGLEGDGGGIDNSLLGTLTVTGSTLGGNSANFGGGIYNTGTLTVTDCTLSSNSAGYWGGGILSGGPSTATLTVTDSTLSGNSANLGGGIYRESGTVTSRNTILAGNTGPTAPDVFGPLTSQGHNLIGDGTGGSGYDPTDLVGTASNPIDPKLGPLQDNGGPTLTMAPLPSSPAIGAGDPTDAPPTDQRGLPRVIDGMTDIGAVELRVFHVTTTADAGRGSLRQAILDANATSGTNGIAFALGAGGVQAIAPTSPLPAVTNPVEIDGATQPGYAGTPLVELAGEGAGPGADGLTLDGNNSTVTGLAIGGFAGAGVTISGSDNRVVGNYLGTNATGTKAHPNGTGVAVTYLGSDNLIGGTAPGAGNLISGNLQDGVGMYGGSGNTVQGNFIGTDASGTQALPNGYGMELFSGSGNIIGGGTVPGAGNLISGNLYDGIGIYGDGNVIRGNRIGTDLAGTKPLGNGQDGVEVLAFQYGCNNLIGGTDPGAGNTIAYNGGYGVRITTGTGNALHQNTIFANAAGGIALVNGANANEPAPALTSAVSSGGTTTIAGTVTGSPGEVLTVECFANPGQSRQGQAFLGSTMVTIGAAGQGSFQFATTQAPVGDFVTATATDAAGDTSRFSNPRQVTGTDAADGSLSGTAVLAGPAPTAPATARSAGAPSSTPAAPLAEEVGTNPALPSEATAPSMPLATVSRAQDAVFAGWDPVPDGLAWTWE